MLVLPSTSSAQDRPRGEIPLLGPTLAYEFGVPVGLDRLPGVVNVFGAAGTGTARAHTAWAGCAFVDPRFVGPEFGVRIDAALGVSTGLFESDPFGVDVLDSATGALTATTNRFTLATTLGAVRMGSELQWRPSAGTAVGFGLWGSRRFALEVVEREEILAPDTARFPAGARQRVIHAGDDLAGQGFRYGLSASIGGRLLMNESLVLEPSLTASVDLPALDDGLSSRAWSFGARLSVLMPYGATGGSRSQLAGRIPGLQLDLYAVDGESISQIGDLRAVEVVHRRIVPLIPVVFFDGEAPVFPRRYVLIDRAAADTFSVAELASLEPLAIARRVLDVIGWRLRLATEAKVTLVASSAAAAQDDIARGRAELVRAYLTDVWRVEPDRVSVKVESKSGPTVPAVEIRSSLRALVEDPIDLEWVERAYAAPTIAMERIIPREGGLRRWAIELKRLGSRVAYFEGEGFPDGRELSGHIMLDSISGHGSEAPIVGDLAVENMYGVRDTAHDELPLRTVPGERETSGGLVIEGIVGVVSTVPVQISQSDDALVNALKLDALKGGDLNVWTGEEGDANRAARIAARLFASLTATDVRLSSVNLSAPAHDPWQFDDSPESRLLAKGVSLRLVVPGQEAGR